MKPAIHMGPPQKILVDLTPLLPGGLNGGAKPFMLALLKELSCRHPEACFTAIVNQAVYEELVPMAKPNLLFVVLETSAADASNIPRLLGSRRLQMISERSLKLLKLIWQSQRNNHAQPDLLFCPFGPPLLNQRGVPIVSTFHDMQVHAYPSFFSPTERQQRLSQFGKMSKRASRIAAISDFSRKVAIENGVDPDRIRTIPLRLANHRATKAVANPPCGVVRGRYVLYPANLWPHKNHEMLLTAFAMARQQGLAEDLQLVCTGDGHDRLKQLRGNASVLNLNETVVLPGFLSDDSLEGLYQHALAVVFPSLYEGFGMPVIEAMARGIPVACSGTTALQEVVGEAALRFHPGNPQEIANALIQLASDAGLRIHLAEQGLRQAAIYSDAGVMADQYWDLFIEAFAAGPKR
jgi:glycosyltransferase involved in cell wall biosynthesis